MNISIFGIGYVGAVSLACLARNGHAMIGVDVDPVKLKLIAGGKSPVIEEALPELMAEVVAAGRVTVTGNAREAMLSTSVSMICVATPSAFNGSQDQTAVVSLTRQLATVLAEKQDYHLFVYRSTVVPGTVEDVLLPILKESGKIPGRDFDVCFQPEFTREGSSIRDFDRPPFTIVGTDSPKAEKVMREIFGSLPCEFRVTSIRTAEMVKYCCNNFHALKITFANEIARLCEALGCDSFEVMNLVCQDTQLNISPAYLKPGFAFGGSCLPKDLRATLYMAKMRDVELLMIDSILRSNRVHVQRAMDKIAATGKRKVGMLGLSFKSGTDDLRESALVTLAENLIGKGYQLSIYDPEVHIASLIGANRSYIEKTIPHIHALMRDTGEEVIRESEIVVAGIGNPQITTCLRDNVRADQVLLDLVHLPAAREWPCEYHGLCWK